MKLVIKLIKISIYIVARTKREREKRLDSKNRILVTCVFLVLRKRNESNRNEKKKVYNINKYRSLISVYII